LFIHNEGDYTQLAKAVQPENLRHIARKDHICVMPGRVFSRVQADSKRRQNERSSGDLSGSRCLVAGPFVDKGHTPVAAGTGAFDVIDPGCRQVLGLE